MSSTYLENLVRTRQLDRVPYSAECVRQGNALIPLVEAALAQRRD